MKIVLHVTACLIACTILSSCSTIDVPPLSDDVAYVHGFIQRISQADEVILVGEMWPPNTNRNQYVRFKLSTTEEKDVLKKYLSKFELRFDPESTISRRDGGVCGCAIWGKISNHFDDQEEYFTFLGEGLISENKAVFAIENQDYDPNDVFMSLVQSGIAYEELEYPKYDPEKKQPLKPVPQEILGVWNTEDNQVEIEFLSDHTYRIHKAPMSFCTHLSKIPDSLRAFHLMGETGTCRYPFGTKVIIFKLAPPLEGVESGWRILNIDSNNMDVEFADYPVVHFVR